ncbi:hypothetical protein [uncultured Alistipes sp.]|uniref:hypothetical protein n=1 Tax=uncultured Alistipes sp. TaxID=538949 RepID=UPI0025AA10CC|nr:hypothetical protein [uncultured Alistipes sp.]
MFFRISDNYSLLTIHYSFFLSFIRAIASAPAAGYRFETTGALTHVGEWGLCWSSSSYAAGQLGSGYLNLNADNVNPLNHGRRASTLSVRCVQHLPGCFLSFSASEAKKIGGGNNIAKYRLTLWMCRLHETKTQIL